MSGPYITYTLYLSAAGLRAVRHAGVVVSSHSIAENTSITARCGVQVGHFYAGRISTVHISRVMPVRSDVGGRNGFGPL